MKPRRPQFDPPEKPKVSVFRSAIDDGHGAVDAGYLTLFWAMIGWSVAGMTVLISGLLLMQADPHNGVALLHEMGIACAAISGGFATVVGAVGLFRAGDKERPNA